MLYGDRRQGQDSASEYSASCIDIALARTAGLLTGRRTSARCEQAGAGTIRASDAAGAL
jgi:hypothetical protein